MVDDVLCCRRCCLRQYVVLVLPKDEISMHLVRHFLVRQPLNGASEPLHVACPSMAWSAPFEVPKSHDTRGGARGAQASGARWLQPNGDAPSGASRGAQPLRCGVCCPPDHVYRSHHSVLRPSSPLRCTCGASGRIFRPIRAEMAEIQTI